MARSKKALADRERGREQGLRARLIAIDEKIVASADLKIGARFIELRPRSIPGANLDEMRRQLSAKRPRLGVSKGVRGIDFG